MTKKNSRFNTCRVDWNWRHGWWHGAESDQRGVLADDYHADQSKSATAVSTKARRGPIRLRKLLGDSDVIFSIVSMPSDVRSIALGDDGVIAAASPGSTYIDMTTSEPSLAIDIYEAAKAKGIAAVDAPVSGGDVGAKSGELSIMVGGDDDVVESLMPCFEAMGKTIVHQGPAGFGQHTKMVNQILVAAGMVGVCEALLYARQSGLNLDTVLKSVSSGAAGSWALTNMGPRIIAGDFEPGFFVDHFVKDLGIAIEGAKKMKLDLPGLALAADLYRRTQENGDGKFGTQRLQRTLTEMSGLTWEA